MDEEEDEEEEGEERKPQERDPEETTPKSETDGEEEGSENKPQQRDEEEEGEERKAQSSGGGNTTTTPSPDAADKLGQLEFTHHIYEEYQPNFPRESKPPIILQTIPQYSVANYFSLSKHQHPLVQTHHHQSHHHDLHRHPFTSPHHGRGGLGLVDATRSHHFSHHRAASPIHLEDNHKLFYGDIPAIHTSSVGSAAAVAAAAAPYVPPPTRHISNDRAPKGLFLDSDSAPPLYLPTSGIDDYDHNQHGSNTPPLLFPVPQPQTIIYEQSPRHAENQPAVPPHPLLKYHLIRHSYPARDSEVEKEYFVDVPAFMPGPPYLPKALPSRKAPTIRRPPSPKRNRQGRLGLNGSGVVPGRRRKRPRTHGGNTGLGHFVEKLIG